MITLRPSPSPTHDCPHCERKLTVEGWYVPGMRCLAVEECPECGRSFYGDLPVGHGLYYPCLLEAKTGTVHQDADAPWFAEWLETAYANRREEPLKFRVDDADAIERPVVLNCLDRIYGHSLLKLLNAQAHLDPPEERDLVVIVPEPLEWCVPDGAAAWTVGLPFDRGTEWNDWLAGAIRDRLAPLDEVALCRAFAHPHPLDIDVERFTGVEPADRPKRADDDGGPTVTFVWRDDRTWTPSIQSPRLRSRLVGAGLRASRRTGLDLGARIQARRFVSVAERLRRRDETVEVVIAGLGSDGSFPAWIADERVADPGPAEERALCRRYARSEVVVGVHGSNMLLPSAHAAATVELVPPDRWGNVVQDLLPRADDRRRALFETRLLPFESTPATLAEVVSSILEGRAEFGRLMDREWCVHDPDLDVEALRCPLRRGD